MFKIQLILEALSGDNKDYKKAEDALQVLNTDHMREFTSSAITGAKKLLVVAKKL